MPKLKPLWLHLDSLAVALREAPALCVGSDFDGTLTAIVPHPDLARLDARAQAALAALVEAPDSHFLVLSGRRLSDLSERLNVQGAWLVGVGGLETQDASGRSVEGTPLGPAIPEADRAGIEAWCKSFPGAWVESKGSAFSVHYRAVPDRNQPAFCAGMRRRIGPFRRTAKILHGKKVYEVLPLGAPDKAGAMKSWIERHEARARVFYFGDDSNDEPVHALVRELGGITVAVGRNASRAEYALASSHDVVWFMEWLAREWSFVHGAPARG